MYRAEMKHFKLLKSLSRYFDWSHTWLNQADYNLSSEQVGCGQSHYDYKQILDLKLSKMGEESLIKKSSKVKMKSSHQKKKVMASQGWGFEKRRLVPNQLQSQLIQNRNMKKWECSNPDKMKGKNLQERCWYED